MFYGTVNVYRNVRADLELVRRLFEAEVIKMASCIPTAEQETVIQFSRNDPGVVIDTSDSTMMTKLDKLVAASAHYTLERVHTLGGEESGRLYRVDDKSLIQFRSKKRQYTEEQKKKMVEQLHRKRQNPFYA